MKIFKATDRCDRCGAQAYHAATKSEYELLFCIHHGKAHNDMLLMTGWEIENDISGLQEMGIPQDAPVG